LMERESANLEREFKYATQSYGIDHLEPIRKEVNHAEAFAARRLSMMRIMARRMKAATVEA
jgi:hypothetical protein